MALSSFAKRKFLKLAIPVFSALVVMLVVSRCQTPEGHQVLHFLDLGETTWDLHSQALPPLLVFGDTQDTSLVERWFLRREDNREESFRLLRLASAEPAGMVVILGDLVFEGADAWEWADFDRRILPLHEKKIPILPIMGNHDYGFLGGKNFSLSQVTERFAWLGEQTWFSRHYGSLGLIGLDSNISEMSSERWQQQKNWFVSELKGMQENPGVSRILVFIHHPPFTNNTRTSDETHVQESFVPAFMATPKAALFIAGHAHGYERFKRDEKWFVVSGGAGGPRVHYFPQDQKKYVDHYDQSGTAERPFHYLKLSTQSQHLEVTVRGFEKGEEQVRTIDQFTIPLML